VLLHHPLDGQSAEADRRDCCSRGNLAPRGAVIKQSAASPNLSRHAGRAATYDWLRDDDIRYKVFVSSSSDLYFAH
jgi:hypothetical protein